MNRYVNFEECNAPHLRNKTVVLDEGDYPQLFSPEDGAGDFLLYFKRLT